MWQQALIHMLYTCFLALLYVAATLQSCRLDAFFPQRLFANHYKALVRFEIVCSSHGTAHYFGEVIRPHWPWLVDSIGSYFHMHAFSGLSGRTISTETSLTNSQPRPRNIPEEDTLLRFNHRSQTVSTGLFISPSGISELDCATTKTDTAERSISIGRESLQVFFVLWALAYFQVPPLGGSRD